MKKTIGWIISILIAIVVYNFAGRGVQGIIWMLVVGVPLLLASEFYLGSEMVGEEQSDEEKETKEKNELEDEIDELLEDI